MKRVMFLSISVILSSVCFSQDSDSNTDVKEHRWMHGFFLSTTQSHLIYDSEVSSPPDNPQPELSNSLGFGLGISTEYKATKHISLRGTAGMGFNGGFFTYTVSDLNQEPLHERDQTFLPFTIDAGIHGIISLKESGVSPYGLLGLSSKTRINHTEDSSDIIASNGFISADFGIGLDAPLTHFNLYPELRYSYALQGMNHALIPEKTYMHQFSLILGFKG